MKRDPLGELMRDQEVRRLEREAKRLKAIIRRHDREAPPECYAIGDATTQRRSAARQVSDGDS